MNLEELDKRLKALEDTEAVKQLHVHYVNCLNKAEYNDLINCFTEDAIVDLHAGYAEGKNQITKLFREEISNVHIGQEGPFSFHPIITVEGDKAKGSWLMYIQFARPRKLKLTQRAEMFDAPDWVQGYYEMEYTKKNREWKISYLKWRNRLGSPLLDQQNELNH
jgi:ketosteroid isomerase-like protein